MMRKKSALNLGAAIIILLSGIATVHAQSAGALEYKFEAGGHFTSLHSSIPREISFTNFQCITTPCTLNEAVISSREFQPGFGGRIGYNLTAHVALEAEVNLFPGADSFSVPQNFRGGHKLEGLFGVKAGKRFERVGIFAKARPGFLYASKGALRPIPNVGCITIFPGTPACLETAAKNSFALDVGAVVEFYPTKRTIIRIDAGDTILRLDDRSVTGIINPGTPASRPAVIPVAAETTHNFQGSIGVSFRF